jgi:BlaI family transcriptional regulator, penicillinase repressor
MTQPIHNQLGRRERQIMDAIYRLGRASVAEVRESLSDPPSYSAVRAMLGFLEDKGYLRHEREGMKYVYLPTVDAKQARRSALQHMVRTFFNGSAAQAAAALIEMNDTQLSQEEIKRLSELIKKARQEGR